jgi:hypothetical protein
VEVAPFVDGAGFVPDKILKDPVARHVDHCR